MSLAVLPLVAREVGSPNQRMNEDRIRRKTAQSWRTRLRFQMEARRLNVDIRGLFR